MGSAAFFAVFVEGVACFVSVLTATASVRVVEAVVLAGGFAGSGFGGADTGDGLGGWEPVQGLALADGAGAPELGVWAGCTETTNDLTSQMDNRTNLLSLDH